MPAPNYVFVELKKTYTWRYETFHILNADDLDSQSFDIQFLFKFKIISLQKTAALLALNEEWIMACLININNHTFVLSS